MTDVVIRDVSDEVLDRIDAAASGAGLTRAEYLRRHIDDLGADEVAAATSADLDRFASHFTDRLDDEVLRDAWH